MYIRATESSGQTFMHVANNASAGSHQMCYHYLPVISLETFPHLTRRKNKQRETTMETTVLQYLKESIAQQRQNLADWLNGTPDNQRTRTRPSLRPACTTDHANLFTHMSAAAFSGWLRVYA